MREAAATAAHRSPFPGMDPYMQRTWRDMHGSLIVYVADSIQPQLPDDLVARIRERLFPDVQPGFSGSSDPLTIRHIEITEWEAERAVTAIEFLTPWHKKDAGRADYVQKLDRYHTSRTNLVEIDLSRPIASWSLPVPAAPRAPYRVTVKRANGQVDAYPIALLQTLPEIPIPLRAGEQDARVALQPLIERVYERGRYWHTDYTKSCDPPLDGIDAEWADQLLKAAGRR